MLEQLVDTPTIYLLGYIIVAAVCLFTGFLLSHMNQDKTLQDYDNGLTVELRKLPPVYPDPEVSTYALTRVGDIADFPHTYLLYKHDPAAGTEIIKQDKLMEINFLQKVNDQRWESGILNEQLAHILLDRAERHVTQSDAEEHKQQVAAMKEYIKATRELNKYSSSSLW